MDDSEELARLAFESYQMSMYGKILQQWHLMPDHWRKNWRASAKAVAERVLAELQSAVEESE